MRCIYCTETDRPFNGKEHVIPQFLGTFRGRSLLLQQVCDDCNNKFSKLETHFKEDSVEGFIAAQYQIRNDSSIRFRRDRMKFKQQIEGGQQIFEHLFPTLDPHTGLLMPTPQIVIEGANGKSQVIFLKGIKDVKNFAKRINWTKASRSTIYVYGAGLDGVGELIQALRDRGVSYAEVAAESFQFSGDEGIFECFFEGRIDETIMRVIAKIAFNYFSFCAIESGFGEIVYEENFSRIREFVLLGGMKSPVEVTNHGATKRGQEHRPHLPNHLILISARTQRIFAELTLFGHLRYVIEIGSYPFLTAEQDSFGSGHEFDLVNKRFFRYDRAKYCIGNTSEFALFSNISGIIR